MSLDIGDVGEAGIVILFGGGDGGGIRIGPNGITRIPPWSPTLLAGLKAVAAGQQFAAASNGKASVEVDDLLMRLTVDVTSRLEEEEGLGGATVLWELDDDWCWTKVPGKLPTPIPGPSQR